MMRLEIRYDMTAPVSHIGETASTGAYFNMIQTSAGRLPVITGNSIRGQIRDAGAGELLDRIGETVDKEVFHVLFSGGNVSASMKDDVGRAAAVRERFPLISLLGGALGTMIMSGKLLCGFAYPICTETEDLLGIPSDVSWHSLIDEIEFTRTDDAKNDRMAAAYISDADAESVGQASQQMRYAVQYMAAGTEFLQRLTLLPGTSDAELGALLSALEYWWRTAPRLGGMSAKGFGAFNATAVLDGAEALRVADGALWISDSAQRMIDLYRQGTMDCAKDFELLKGAKKNGKKSNGSD